MNRNVVATILATVAVIVVALLGFRFLGGPGTQRKVQLDNRRTMMLAQLAQQINQRWGNSDKALPETLKDIPDSTKLDPVTHQAFGYHPKTDHKYQLCANFETDDREERSADVLAFWKHPKGDFCFELDTTRMVPNAPYYY